MEAPITVDEALTMVLQVAGTLGTESLSIGQVHGRVVAEDIHATADFPPFQASIMDGYAVIGPLQAGHYPVLEKVYAGKTPEQALTEGGVAYITTGAMLPPGANAVVKIEDTAVVEGTATAGGRVSIKVDVKPGTWVREIGSDIAAGEVVLERGQVIGAAEIGLLVTIGRTSDIVCWKKPVVGVLSTGSELVDAMETPIDSQIRDSNRPCIIASLKEDGFDAVDLGIVSDSKEELRKRLLEAGADCDVVVTSGGVSMGAADFVKPLLKEIGTVHFEKLKMKPGKPTTFASFCKENTENGAVSSSRQTLFFGLPGNPVSCLVTKALFVDPALKRLQGLDAVSCMLPQLLVKLKAGMSIKLDDERPEYHRVTLEVDSPPLQGGVGTIGMGAAVSGAVFASSTGFQRSSRLMSMKSANGLLVLPKGPGTVQAGSTVLALLTKPLSPPPLPSQCAHPIAAAIDSSSTTTPSAPLSSSTPATEHEPAVQVSGASSALPLLKPASSSSSSSSASTASTASVSSGAPGWTTIRTALLTVSDRASQGVYADESGPAMAQLLREMSASPDWPLTILLVQTAIVPDEPERIQSTIKHWIDPSPANPDPIEFVLTSGGTGFGLRDLTPEAVLPLLHRQAPGIAQALLNEGLKHTPLAVMSRPVAGTRHESFICTLPGSVKAIKENIVCLKPLLPRIFELLKEGKCSSAPPSNS